jgi:hypothetical protein
VNVELAVALPDEFSPRGQITAPMSCGASANRLCEILRGNSLQDYTCSPDAIRLSETDRVTEALKAMRGIEGYFLVRINVIGGGAGHRYVFLSAQRKSNDSVSGFI